LFYICLAMNLLLIFLGGGAGSIARYGMMNVISRALGGPTFPWYTLGVNMLGALCIGALMEILALRASLAEPMKLLLVTGFLGGFTTFSAFSLEGALMLEKGDYTNLALYIVASVGGTIIAVFLGSGIVRTVL
jgi:CrcB protein